VELKYLQSLKEKQLGHLGEILVEMKLTLWGFECTMCHNHALPYDLLLVHGGKCYRVQVKASRTPQGSKNSYAFALRHGAEKRSYEDNSYDLLCCVALDMEKIVFFPKLEQGKKGVMNSFFAANDEYQNLVDVLGKVKGA